MDVRILLRSILRAAFPDLNLNKMDKKLPTSPETTGASESTKIRDYPRRVFCSVFPSRFENDVGLLAAGKAAQRNAMRAALICRG